MADNERQVVTGAFGYTGKYIARRLLEAGKPVTTLTGHPDRPDPLADSIDIARLAFDDPAELTAVLRGAHTLFNTYWVRFDHGETTFAKAVENTRTLFAAARAAGVKRVVHISITNPTEDSALPYFRGKAELERALVESGLSYAIVRPAVVFGTEDILINNIAWLLRRLPIFVIAGSGDYRVQPVFVGDLADIAVNAAARDENLVIDAVGPESFTFEELVQLIAERLGVSRPVLHLSPRLALLVGRLLGSVVDDVILTQDELRGLMGNLLVSSRPPTGHTRFSDWLNRNAKTLGAEYASELERHFR